MSETTVVSQPVAHPARAVTILRLSPAGRSKALTVAVQTPPPAAMDGVVHVIVLPTTVGADPPVPTVAVRLS